MPYQKKRLTKFTKPTPMFVEVPSQAGFKKPIKKFSEIQMPTEDTMDLHAWVDIEGLGVSDYDEDQETFINVKRINKLEGDMIRVPMVGEEKSKAFKMIYKKHIKKRIKMLIEMNELKITADAINYWLKCAGSCFLRAYIISKYLGSSEYELDDFIENPKLLLDNSIPCRGFQVGSAGWKSKASGKVWYEYG